MKRFTRISMALLVCAILAAITGCSKISRIKNSISGDKFTEIAEDYGLEVGKKENSSITTYIAQGNDIYAEFYVFDKNSYVSTSYQYITGNIESAFEDITAETETMDGEYPRFQMKADSLNAVASVIGNTMVYAYSTSASGIGNVDELWRRSAINTADRGSVYGEWFKVQGGSPVRDGGTCGRIQKGNEHSLY